MPVDGDRVSIYIAVLLSVSLLLSIGIVIVDSPYPNISGSDTNKFKQSSNKPFSDREPIVEPSNNITVISSQSGQFYAFAPDGRLLYYNDNADSYWDVDPSKDGKHTVMVVASTNLNDSTAINYVQQINLTTKETEILYSKVVPRYGTYKWHDVDYVGPQKLAIADMAYDSAFIINTSSGDITFEWFAYQYYSLESGGEFPRDWTHINDIEVTEYGLMLSLRNQDSVVFVEKDKGIIENMTLGGDNNHQILYEQHNPDYIPEERGGPAIIVADSQNNRIIEYQFINGNWKQTWKWKDAEMSWPRDADRLPNGHTLIADSNSGRIIEINESGNVVWQISNIPNYDVERLGTGDESTGGYSAEYLELQTNNRDQKRQKSGISIISIKQRIDSFSDSLLGILPKKIENAIRFTVPSWMGPTGIISAGVSVASVVGLAILSFKRSRYTIQSPISR